MSLRRTGIARKAELRRTPIARKRQPKKVARRRDTGPTPAQRNLVLERAGGCCELCLVRLHNGDAWTRDHSFHHRRPRGAGGTRLAAINSPANVLLLCGTGTTGCHGKVEANRATAYAHGWLVKNAYDPATTPVDIGPFHISVRLNDAGDYEETAA